MKKLLFFIYIWIPWVACAQGNRMVHVNVEASMKTSLTLKLSSIVKKLEWVRLETNADYHLGALHTEVAVFEKDIAVSCRNRILLFDRTTGRFKKEVLRRGIGPKTCQYTLVGSRLPANESNGNVFIKEWDNSVSSYNIYTEERKRIATKSVKAFAYTDDDSFVATAPEYDGKNQTKMWIYENDECVDSIPNNRPFELETDAIAVFSYEDIFYRYKNRTYYKSITNDTVYSVTNKLTPTYLFYPANSMPQLELRKRQDIMFQKMFGLFVINKLMEDKNYLYYTIKYKEEEYNLVHQKASGKGGVLKEGFRNDIDGGINLFPDHITERGEYVFVINPAFLSEEELAKCQLKEDDNLVIVIGRQ